MATYNKFNTFIEDLGDKVHDLNDAGDTLKIYLTNNAPDAENDAVKADLVGITEENGYAPADVQNDWSRTTTVAKLTGVDYEWTAAGGSFGPFRYVVLYNDTPTSPADPLIAWWDYGSSITCNTGEKFKADFGTEIFDLS